MNMRNDAKVLAASSPRVAYFAGSMKPGHDGVTRVLYRLIDALTSRSIDHLFFSPLVPEGSLCSPRIRKVPSIQFPLHREYRLAVPGSGSFEKELAEFKPDLLHINSPCSLGYAAVRYGNKHGIPVVATYHTHFPSYAKYYGVVPLTGFAWNYMRRLYRGCERVFVPSVPITEELRSHGLYNLQFLPHGVDTVAFHPQYRSQEWREKLGIRSKTILLFVGRLVWEKDLRVLASAYQLIKERRSDTALVIVGDGPAREELEHILPDAIFLGYQSGVSLSEAYASSDIFLMPSTTETFGNVTVEAMASGMAPVCAAEGGACGLVQDGSTGLLARPRDAADFAEKTLMLVEQPGKRAEIADQALQFARRQTWDHIFDELIANYNDVLREYRNNHIRDFRRAA